jgi:hypothetical protein
MGIKVTPLAGLRDVTMERWTLSRSMKVSSMLFMFMKEAMGRPAE